MKRPLQEFIFVLAVACLGSSCQPESSGNADANGNRPNGNSQSNANNGKATPKAITDDFGPATPENDKSADDNDAAMIISVKNDVRLRRKGATNFVHIPGGLFRSGDLLRVGDASTAFVDCNEAALCSLGKGDYPKCCGDVCESRVALRPPEGTQRTAMVKIAELPPDQLQLLRNSESQIRALEADDVTTQFLIANLYSSWKVKEANQEVDKLSEKLRDPQAPQKLDTLYWPMLKKNADLYKKLDDKGQAEQTYKKLTEVAVPTDQQTKADAHVSLGLLYKETGRKEEAVQNLQKGKQLYEAQGNQKKAEDVRKTIVKIQNQ